MRIIAIESSGPHGSVAALRGERAGVCCLEQMLLPDRERTAQSLAPSLRAILHKVDWPADSLELVCVTVGPGSFTGLRIGVTTAKTLAYAVGAQIVGSDTLEVLAAQAPAAAGRLWTIMDAQRQELFAAAFEVVDASRPRRISETTIMGQETWLAKLQAGDRVTGPALQQVAARLPAEVLALPVQVWQPMAAAVGQVAWRAYQAGQRDDVWKLLPNYFRPSAAEEKHRRT
ncbi:MAG TPA: tRNA (adenosine(37)-N6)-threonylcarbamoyltransferase complex dimerization subunit type 1 TsaB [Lacipirellulaceae bacterium]|nr:tRNA (adenosine(37)-N6)-threonylcarbamoyltransferase complex dimerization subunit type 1 TsaB [Lacipirellulaceae bacterium]